MTNIRLKLDQLLSRFNGNPPVDPAELAKFEGSTHLKLPDAYVQFLHKSNGGEGFVGGTYVIFWPIEMLDEMNVAYEVDQYAPGLFLFGSDGGGEGFAFDHRDASMPIVSVPFVGMELRVARRIAQSFAEFLEELWKM